ncbi:MAG: hypothetical protein H0U54_05280 [Acidobacteria bacterium]|jgi:hypothetical protein|nr:hypothetical protein [Acidobacteriota bacterium]
MKKHEDYISGPHHFWMHFWFGLVFGGALGAWLGWQLFESAVFILPIAGATALAIAYCCGRWGDSVWHWLIEWFSWTA